MNDYNDLFICEEFTIFETIQIIDKNRKRTAFLVEDGRLKGVVSDGDIRRFILNNGDVKESVKQIINYTPIYLNEINDVKDYKQYMIRHAISALPIVDECGKIIRIEFLDNSDRIYNKLTTKLPVVVMAGGKGSRLRPYTDIIPKPLIPIGEKTITEHILDQYTKFGCDEFYVIVNYKKNLIEAYFKELEIYSNIYFVEENRFQGTAGGLKLLPQNMEHNFFVTNCDILVTADYCEMWNEHITKNNIITMICAKKKINIPYGTVCADEANKVIALEEKPSYVYNVNTGMYICNKRVLDYINDDEFLDMPTLIQRCIDADEKVGQYQIASDEWMDMGQSKELENMKQNLNLI